MSQYFPKSLLLVEDEFLVATNEKTQLEKYGYVVLTASSGEEAIALTKCNPSIDLILMDINLGAGIDGTQAAEMILKDHDIPILFLSCHIEPEVVEKTEKISSYGYVVKNSSITVLDASIKMAFKLFESRNEFQKIFNLTPALICVAGSDGYF
ncbi:MAG: response regulator, partial [Rectinemataceae bacterium]